MKHTDKMIGKIMQIIPWEKKEEYFSKDGVNFGSTPIDLVMISEMELAESDWKKRLREKKEYTMMWVSRGFQIAVERPNDLKVGDIMEVELTITRTKKADAA
jgi:hypothetical protein